MSFEELAVLVEEGRFSQLKMQLSDMNEVDIAEFMKELNRDKVLVVFRILPKDMCAAVFTYMEDEQRQAIIMSMSDKDARYLIDNMFIDDAVDFLEEMPAIVVKKALKSVEENTRKTINEFLKYPEGSAGSIMTVEFVEFHLNTTVREAINIIRKTGIDKETVYTCYVIDAQRKLLGSVALRTLLLANDDTLVQDIMKDRVISARTLDDREKVAADIRKYDFLSIPVTDTEGRLVGIITVDDAIDVIQAENTEDFQRMAALSPSEKPYLKTNIWTMSQNRVVWLLFLMLSATLTGIIIKGYEDLLLQMFVLSTFIPMLTGTGGNAGSQSATLIIRSLALGEISNRDLLRVIWKELRVSAICGGVLAAVNCARLLIFGYNFMVCLVVSLTVWVVVIFAKIVGALLPIGAKTLKLDPAIMASPLIATIVDASSLMIYFSIATVVLS